MIRIKYISILLILFITTSAHCKIVKYNEELLNINYSSWVSPFKYYKTAYVVKQTDDLIRIDKGDIHGVIKGFVYNINKKSKLVISSVFDNYSEGYIINENFIVEEGTKIIFDDSIELEENSIYASCTELEIKTQISVVEKDLCYATLPETSYLVKGQPLTVLDNTGQKVGLVETMEIIPGGISVFKVVRKDIQLDSGYMLVTEPRNVNAWKNLGLELSKSLNLLPASLFSFYKAYEMDKTNPIIAQGFKEQALKLAAAYEKNKQDYKSAIVYRQCQTVAGGCKDELKNSLTLVKDEATKNWETKNNLLAIKNFEILDQDKEIKTKLSVCYNNEAANYSFKENTEYQVYLYSRACEIDPENILAAKNLLNLYLFLKDYDNALAHLKVMKKNITAKEEQDWIARKIDDVDRIQKGLTLNYKFKNLEQRVIELSSLKGNIVLLIQWSMKNDISNQTLSYLTSLNEKYKSKGLKLLAVNVDPRGGAYAQDIKNFMTSFENFDFEIVYSEEDLKDLFLLKSFPESVLIDKDGKVAHQESGAISDDLEQLIKQMIK